MSSEEAKKIVTDGLERRKAQRQEAEQEVRLERYEQEQIHACNKNFAGAKLKRDAEAATQRTIQEAAARRAARADALAKKQAREDAAMSACRYYGLACLGVLWLTAVTRLPFWAAVTLILGLAIFPVAYIFRLYFPAEQ